MIQKYSNHPHLVIMGQAENENYFEVPPPLGKNQKSEYNYTTTALNIQSNNHYNNLSYVNARKGYRISDDENNEMDGLFKSLRSFLIFGKIIGVLPFSGVFESGAKHLSFRPKSPTACVTYVITVILIFNCALSTTQSIRAQKRNALEIANSIRETMYFMWGCYIYITFIYRANDFLRLFRAWGSTIVHYRKKDVNLRRDVNLIAGTILISAILENSVLHLEYIDKFDYITGQMLNNSTRNMSTVGIFLKRSHPQWSKLFGYDWPVALLAFIQHKWTLYAWNYMDILIAVLARAMYFRFKALYDVAENTLLGSREAWIENEHEETKAYRDTGAWLQIVHDHLSLYRLLNVLEDFLSHLIFISYFVNMYYLSLQLLEGMTADVARSSFVRQIYTTWSFLHLMLRIFVISICCSRINVYAHKIRDVFQECPVECYTKEIARVERQITGGPEIGLTGMRSFTVTKPFILGILSVLFTMEIVLLQCVPSDITPQNCTKAQ